MYVRIKKAEHQRIDAFKLWYWRRLLRVLWTARRSNQSILKEINPEFSLEGLTLKLKLQYFSTWCKELTHWKRPWYWERLRRGNRGWDGWMASLTQWARVWAKSGRQWRTGKPGVLHSMGLQNQTWLRDWATIIFLNELINTWELRMGLPRFSDKESPCQCRICGFHPWVKKISWRRKWQPTPVFLPGKSHVQRNSVSYTPWGQKELDTTKEQQKELRLNLLSLHPTDSSYLNRYLSILLKNQRERFLLACFLHSLPSFLHYTSIWLPTKCQTLILLGLQQHTQFQESLQSGGGVLVIYGSL